MPKKNIRRAVTVKRKAKPKAKQPNHRQLQLPAVMTGPQVQALLGKKRKDKGPVSHVTIVNLVAAGKLKRIGRAKQQGGGWLYDSEQVKKFARSYNPQDKPVRDGVDEDALSWLTTVPADDVNFKGHLKVANIATVKAALATRAVKKTVTKRKVLQSRLRKLLRLQAGG